MKTSERPSKLHQHLHTYALAASAAGVSMLALTQPGEAEIVYTPANVDIGPYSGTYALDLNGDGTTDFFIVDRCSGCDGSSSIEIGSLLARPAQGNEIANSGAPLRAGTIISNADFSSKGYSWFMAGGVSQCTSHRCHNKGCGGSWKNKKSHYLGLQFMISGQVHYGWARLSVSCVGPRITTELTGYAYETIPDKGIVAGKKKGKLEDENLNGPDEPTPRSVPAPTAATLGMLAKGAQALSVWRRE